MKEFKIRLPDQVVAYLEEQYKKMGVTVPVEEITQGYLGISFANIPNPDEECSKFNAEMHELTRKLESQANIESDCCGSDSSCECK